MLRHQRAVGFNQRFEPADAALKEGLVFLPGQIRLCIDDFERSGYVNTTRFTSGGDDRGMPSSFTASGIEYAEDIEATNPELGRSNRFTKLADQSAEIEALRSQVVELTKQVSENRDNSFNDKEGVLAELAALELLLTKPQLSVPLIEKIVSETVVYLGRTFTDQSIGVAAGVVITLTIQAFGLSLPR